MMNMLKNNLPWLYQIIIAIGIALWFDGVNMIARTFVSPTRNVGLIFCGIALFIFLLDDGRLNELHNFDRKNSNNNRNKIAAAVAGINN